METTAYNSLQRWAYELDGVFTIADLKVALNNKVEDTTYKQLAMLVQSKGLIKVKRGMYATPEATLAAISHRINPGAYISTGTVLAQNMMIGSVPARRLQAVKVGPPRIYSFELGTIEHLSIHPKLNFGFIPVNGILYANREKAFLDTCYYHYKGKSFSFDPASDIHTQDLDWNQINRYLEHYDQRFVTYFNRLWRDHD